ncbi:MAG: hypothetical protein KKH72_13175 [Alphaproteobacteria bacterium]|nr:hypothetical protein [Alphaproteobacteria bacterium]
MLEPGDPLTYWQVTDFVEARYDVADAPMQGKMDSTFFLTKDKNIIPHTYPCRTAYIAEARDVEPVPAFMPDWDKARNVLPFGSAFLDLSGFWFRATRLSGWARTALDAQSAGKAVLRLGICGAAKLFVNGAPVGWLAPTARNAMHEAEFEVDLVSGRNDIAVWFEDLAERDAVVRILLTFVSGPQSAEAMPFAADSALVVGIETALSAMHLDKIHYDDAEIWLDMPEKLPTDATARVTVAGHFMSHDSQAIVLDIPAGTERMRIGHSRDFPPDYRYFQLRFACGGFETDCRLGAEISRRIALGPAPAARDARIAEALRFIADNAEGDTEKALALLAEGRPDDIAKAHAIFETFLPVIADCWDCADFALVPLLFCRIAYANRIAPDMRARIDETALIYRYWMDEPGNDVQWYFSENHALLFHTAAYLAGALLPEETFVRSKRKGREQSRVGLERLVDWFDHFEAAEMAEFNSASYFPIDFKGLTALFALAPDTDIRARAEKAIVRLLTIVANSAHHGVISAAQGRSYEHTLIPVDTLELTGIARLVWGLGSYGSHVNCLAQIALCLRDHGLDLPDLGPIADWSEQDAQEWMFWQGENAFARLYHHKTADTALGSAARYRWGDWGYQETLIHARIGREPRAQIWINYPGEMVQSGYGRPSFWGGSANVPRVQQYRDLALVVFDGVKPQLDFTHCWFPTSEFEDWRLDGDCASARSGKGMLTIKASGPLALQKTGASANAELRLGGRDGVWLVRLGRGGDLAGFAARHAHAIEKDADGTYRVTDAEYGRVEFRSSGVVAAEGRELDPRTWTMQGERRRLPA